VPSYPEADVAISGVDRYQTAALVADVFFVLPGSEGPVLAGLATGANFPDALSGGAVMAPLGGPMLLTTPTTLNAHRETFLTQNRDTIHAAFIFGDNGAVSNLVDGQVAARHRGPSPAPVRNRGDLGAQCEQDRSLWTPPRTCRRPRRRRCWPAGWCCWDDMTRTGVHRIPAGGLTMLVRV
jgi:hypothetical protein